MQSQITQKQNYKNISKFSQKKMKGKDVGEFPKEKEMPRNGVKTTTVCTCDDLRSLGKAKELYIRLVQVHSKFKLHQRTTKY